MSPDVKLPPIRILRVKPAWDDGAGCVEEMQLDKPQQGERWFDVQERSFYIGFRTRVFA